MKTLQYIAETTRLDMNQVDVPRVDANSALQSILTTTYFWAGIVCVLVIIVAGFFYVTSAGNAATIKKAKDAILGAVIGLVVIMMAFAITAFVIGRL
jgi:hypothetical protein